MFSRPFVCPFAPLYWYAGSLQAQQVKVYQAKLAVLLGSLVAMIILHVYSCIVCFAE